MIRKGNAVNLEFIRLEFWRVKDEIDADRWQIASKSVA